MDKIKTKLKGRKIKCEYKECLDYKTCTKYSTDHHHKFPNTKHNRKIYGDLIDCDFNILYIAGDCHITKVIPHLTEIEFRAIAFDSGYTNLSMSKSMQFKKFN